jgi:nucleoside-diphosphate-sugar epimerase
VAQVGSVCQSVTVQSVQKEFKMANVLIIGGTGLISTAISQQLVAAGYDVTHYNRGQRAVRIQSDVRTLHGDRNDFARFEQHMADVGTFDCVIDMICFTPEQAESAVRAFKGRTGQFIFTSTVDVYSKPASRYPIRENEPRKGNNSYGSNKILCEDIFFQAQDVLNVTIIRPAMTYGESGSIVELQGWGTKYIDRIRKGKPIVVHGDGSALWVACHIDDAAGAFVGAVGNTKAYGKAYHVTGEEWLTWNAYYAGVAEALNAPMVRLVHIPTDVLMRVAPDRMGVVEQNFQGNNIFDNTVAMTDLGFRYTIGWVEGVRRTVAWLDANGKVVNSDDDPFDDQLVAAWNRSCDALAAELG